jgi:CRP-like cAMP-binding protein
MGILPPPSPSDSRNDTERACLGYLRRAGHCKTVRVVPPKNVIFSQTEGLHSLCMISDGLVKLTHTRPDGKEVIVGLRRKGWLLGMANALSPQLPYFSTAETLTRSRLCFVSREAFDQALNTDAQFGRWVATIASQGVYDSLRIISERSGLSGRRRLEAFLVDLIQAQNRKDLGRTGKIAIPLKNWELAQLLGLTPEHLSRLIGQMEREGVLLWGKAGLFLSKPERLRRPDGVSG